MIKFHILTKYTLPLLILGISAQNARSASSKSLKARFVPLGHHITPTYKLSEKDEVVIIPTPEGGTKKHVIPAGTSTLIKGERFEYLPQRFYIKNKSSKTNGEYIYPHLNLNASSSEIELTPRSKLTLSIRKSLTDRDAKDKLRTYLSTPVEPEQTNILVAIIRRYTTKEGWEKPLIKSFNTSYSELPPKSLFLYNATPINIEIQVPHQNKIETKIIKPFTSYALQPSVNKRGDTVVIAKSVSSKGKKKQFYRNAVKITEDGRAYLLFSFNPIKNNPRPVSSTQFYDKISPPVKK